MARMVEEEVGHPSSLTSGEAAAEEEVGRHGGETNRSKKKIEEMLIRNT